VEGHSLRIRGMNLLSNHALCTGKAKIIDEENNAKWTPAYQPDGLDVWSYFLSHQFPSYFHVSAVEFSFLITHATVDHAR
jgi:hypothetical protein